MDAGATPVDGTGNALANAIIGSGAANRLHGLYGSDTMDALDGHDMLDGGPGADSLIGGNGNDTLDGGPGADSLIGGVGDDTYVVDSVRDVVVETHAGSWSGYDRVTASVSYRLAENVEALTLDGAAFQGVGNVQANEITGNSLANRLLGGGGSDSLDGRGGPDTLVGGAGDDFYVVEPGDVVVETTIGGGRDTISAATDWTLEDGTEVLFLHRGLFAALGGTGNARSNTVSGSYGNNLLSGLEGNDSLDGGYGNDTLVGGAGRDRLRGGSYDQDQDVFRFLGPGDGHDFLEDFCYGDRIEVSAEGFGGGLAEGTVLATAGRFVSSPSAGAVGALAQFAYDTTTGRLWWDANGAAAGGRSLVAVLKGTPLLDGTDIVVIA